MMFFLANIGGSYVPRLLVSTDRLVWTQKAIQHTGESPSQTYYALGVLPFAGGFATYYGNGGTMEASSSANLLAWKNAPSYRIQNDLTTFSATSRDPYVFKDPEVGLYRCISSAYRANEGWGYGSGLDVSLALSTSTGNSLEGWQTVQKELIRFEDGLTGEPECPQMLRIGNRWYIIASMARRSSNFVGRLSYWIGDAGKGIDDVDWKSKTEHFLDGEDVCAAQIAYDGAKFRMWGWIPESYNGGTWGGHLSLPRIVSALPDGRLTASPDVAVIERAEGETVGTLVAANLSSGNSQLVETGVIRVSYTVTLSFTDSVQIRVGGAALQLDKTNGRLSILRVSDGRIFSSFDAGNGALDGEIEIKVIAEDNILEVFVADRWSLAGRCDVILKNDHTVGVASIIGTVNVFSGTVNRLKYLEELQQ